MAPPTQEVSATRGPHPKGGSPGSSEEGGQVTPLSPEVTEAQAAQLGMGWRGGGGGRSAPMVPWATLALVAANVAFFCRPVRPPSETCLSVQSVWSRGQWTRLLWAPFHHLGLGHLLLNMAALFWLGWGLEEKAGGLGTGVLLLALALLGGLVHLGLNALLVLLTGRRRYWEHCAVGFSGVLFSLEAMGGQLETFPVAAMATGVPIPTRWLCILECLALAFFYPRSSFTGHLSGILLGLTLSSTDLLGEVI